MLIDYIVQFTRACYYTDHYREVVDVSLGLRELSFSGADIFGANMALAFKEGNSTCCTKFLTLHLILCT